MMYLSLKRATPESSGVEEAESAAIQTKVEGVRPQEVKSE